MKKCLLRTKPVVHPTEKSTGSVLREGVTRFSGGDVCVGVGDKRRWDVYRGARGEVNDQLELVQHQLSPLSGIVISERRNGTPAWRTIGPVAVRLSDGMAANVDSEEREDRVREVVT